MRKIFSFFKSIKLAVVLILIITLLSLLSTLVPQQKEAAFYYHTYSPGLAKLMLAISFDHFFRSFLFMAPAALFFLNLLTCTVDRLSREIRKKKKRRFGPDILHIGLLVLIVGSIVTFTGRKEGYMTLGEGDEVNLPGGYRLKLESFEFLKYENGAPKDWISTVTVEKDGSTVVKSYAIEVNKPLKIGKIELFQSSYSMEYTVELTADSGEVKNLKAGEYLELPDSALVFAGAENIGTDNPVAIFQEWQNRNLIDEFGVQKGESIAGFIVGDADSRNVTGLQAVIDPGFTPVLIGLILLAIGLFLTYYQKLGEKK